MAKILITGGAGYIGPHIVNLLGFLKSWNYLNVCDFWPLKNELIVSRSTLAVTGNKLFISKYF